MVRGKLGFLAALVAVSLVGLAADRAFGGIVVESAPFAFPLSPGSQPLSIPKFDTMGGTRTLTQVDLKISGSVEALVTAENDSAIGGNMGVDLIGLLKASIPGPLSTSAGILQSAGPVAVAASDGNPGSGPDFVDFGLISGAGSNSTSTNSGLAAYIGPGFLAGTASGNGGFSINGVTDSTSKITNFQALGTVDVIYTYTENNGVVPEPASLIIWSVLGLSVIGAGWVRKRIRRK
ncbi:MAG: choice-of-anchor E domain-containing protein [Pirellulales bacterium]|nr:choice-of-anchor E domain-containing protein [Pirellulales bacterium]